MDMPGVSYVGTDSSARVISDNTTSYGGENRRFFTSHITADILPPADVVMSRESFSRLPYAYILMILRNFLRSPINWFLFSTHSNATNREISEPGTWRQLNLQKPPFNFPPPVEELVDYISGHPVRMLALWSREQLEFALAQISPPQPSLAPAAPVSRFRKGSSNALPHHTEIISREMEVVTVVYGPEVGLLELQARSFAGNLDHNAVKRVHVIINEEEPEKTISRIEKILPLYGPHEPAVKLWRASEISDATGHRGWRTQQSLKLLISRKINTPKYLVLDAKNHFIRPTTIDTFLCPDGRPRSFWTKQSGNLGNFLKSTLRYLDIDPAHANESVMPAITPYVMYTSLVSQLIEDIEFYESEKFEHFFHRPGIDLTEFFLYYAYLRNLGIDPVALYDFGKRYAVTLFTRHPDSPERLTATLAKLEDSATSVFGLHRNRIRGLDDISREKITRSWVSGGVFLTAGEAESFYSKLANDIDEGH
jgi:hypothetical protein